MVLKVGLTGGIGSGKSTVSSLFAQLGVPVIDADVIAHELAQPNTTIAAKIIAHFGDGILDAQGKLQRKALREIIFQYPEERKWLEDLLHPLILEEMQQQAAKINAPYCLMVIPLLAESQRIHFLDRICVIDVPEHLQIERAQKRDDTTKEDVAAIVKSQIDREKRLAIADDVLLNDRTLKDLEVRVHDLHNTYLNLTKTTGN